MDSYADERCILHDQDPPPTENAITAVEDARFRRHGGVDLRGILSAARDNITASFQSGRIKIVRGASTLTMQVAGGLFLDRTDRSIQRKANEALMAVEIEKRYSKDQILTLYCNQMNLGHRNYGMESGARYYFGKTAAELNLPQAAMLAGIPQLPSVFSPYRNPERTKKRRDHVLERMLAEGMISAEDYESAVASPLGAIEHRRQEERTGDYFSEEVRRYLESNYGRDQLYQGGLKVATTLDRRIQDAAESSLRETLLEHDHRRKGWRGPLASLTDEPLEEIVLPSWREEPPAPNLWHKGLVLDTEGNEARIRINGLDFTLASEGMAWTKKKRPSSIFSPGDVAWFVLEEEEVEESKDKAPQGEPVLTLQLQQEPLMESVALVVESATGAVRAMVGGWDFDRNQFNRSTQALRQVGSAFKPIVYVAALENGFTAADTLFDGPVTFRGADNLESYSPRNYYRKYNGIITLRRALELSVNVPAVKLLDLVGVNQVVDVARRLGITNPLPPYPSLALGSADLTPLELATVYATIANHGLRVNPYFVEKITRTDGRVIEKHLPVAEKALDEPVAWVVTQILHGVTQRGTATKLRGLDVELAGKTGTTNDHGDAWFAGFTPRYTIVTWVGYDQKKSLGRGMTGAAAALPIFKKIVERGLEEGWILPGEKFTAPAGVEAIPVERTSGLLPGPGALEVIPETFIIGTAPTQTFDEVWARHVNLPWYQQEAFYIPKEGEKMPEDIRDWQIVRDAWTDKD